MPAIARPRSARRRDRQAAHAGADHPRDQPAPERRPPACRWRVVASVPTSAPAIAVTAMATTRANASTSRDRSTRKLGHALSTSAPATACAVSTAASVQAARQRRWPARRRAAAPARRDPEQRHQRGEADAGHRPQPRHVCVARRRRGRSASRWRRRGSGRPVRPGTADRCAAGRRSSNRGAQHPDRPGRASISTSAPMGSELAIDVADEGARATPAPAASRDRRRRSESSATRSRRRARTRQVPQMTPRAPSARRQGELGQHPIDAAWRFVHVLEEQDRASRKSGSAGCPAAPPAPTGCRRGGAR